MKEETRTHRKYRAYSKKFKKMVYSDDPKISIHVHGDGECILWRDGIDDECAILSESIGQYDINGKEVYEGDILFVKGNPEITKKEYLNERFVIVWNEAHSKFWGKSLKKKFKSDLFFPHIQHYAKIIGNIYQKK
mgnify:CR=1 FL=1